MNPQSYYTLASYCKIISDQKNNFLALLIRYQYSSSDENGTYMKTSVFKREAKQARREEAIQTRDTHWHIFSMQISLPVLRHKAKLLWAAA